MKYFSGIQWQHAAHIPHCGAWIDQDFPHSFALNFASEGSVIYARNGDTPVTLSAPVAWGTLPGPHYTYGVHEGHTWDHYYASFRGPLAERMVSEGLYIFDKHPYVFITDAIQFQTSFEKLISSLQQRPVENPRACLLLEDLLLQTCAPLVTARAKPPREKALLALMDDLRQRPESHRDWHKEAASLAMSEVHFRREFKRVSGLPPTRFVIYAAMDKAAQLLRTSDNPVKAIASTVGYDDVYHFTKSFKKRYGIAPATYRNETAHMPSRAHTSSPPTIPPSR